MGKCRRCGNQYEGAACKPCKALYRKENSERRREYDKKWKEEHKDYVRKRAADYYLNNKEQDNERSKKNYRLNRESYFSRAARRRSKEREAGLLSKGIFEKLLLLQRNKCACCKSDLSKKKIHRDHIVPIAKGGKNEDSNIQLLCSTCNLQKHAKHPIEFMQSKGYLL